MEKKFWIWFSRIRKLTVNQKIGLIEKYGSPEEIWRLSANDLRNESKYSEECIEEILKKEYRTHLYKYEEYMEKNEIKMITLLDKEYPDRLKEIYDKPIVLFAKGNTNLLKEKCVAIVGARECSDYGKKVTENVSYNLAKENICIVSGLANGIDGISHKSAINAGGKTIAVIGCGLDYIYPYKNKEIYERIINTNSLIVTEYIIGTKPEKLNFPARNRIISALSEAIIVIEAKEKSGALITAEFGIEQGKEIFAVPGNINSNNSKGTNNLIKDGANVLTNYNDVLAFL